MDKMDKLIMVVPRELLLPKEKYFEGYISSEYHDYVRDILTNYQWRRRGDMEFDPAYKQPILYCSIVNRKLGKVFAYQRAKNNEGCTEERIEGKWSWGVGGHVDKDTDGMHTNPLSASLKRELSEEVDIRGLYNEAKVVGYLNFEDAVETFHFSILCIVETSAKEIFPRDKEIHVGKYRSLFELEEMVSSSESSSLEEQGASPRYDVEKWSKKALHSLRQYFDNKSYRDSARLLK